MGIGVTTKARLHLFHVSYKAQCPAGRIVEIQCWHEEHVGILYILL
jgi:hypothetical protein